MNPTNSFPVLCQDNFFDNPDEIREYALSLDYKTSEDVDAVREQPYIHLILN